MKSKAFCVFVISHGRPNNLVTLRSLKRAGYTGELFIVCDNEDKSIDEYKKNYGESVVVFDKIKYASMVDSCDNFQNRRTTTHARNACFDIAKQKGFEYFLVLDDDYTGFMHNFDRAGRFKRSGVKKANDLFAAVCDMLESDDRISSICFIQGGDLIGGDGNGIIRAFPFKRRKAMNTFFCKTSRRFWFFSRLNEDVNTYLMYGSRGSIFMSIPEIAINQLQTQANTGGMSDAYIASGTYVKSFYSTMLFPSFVKVSVPSSMKEKRIRRIHHKVYWNNAVPKIIDDAHKKR
jgi:hypothetical protein